MSSKLKLKPNPTFRHSVPIPVPGSEDVTVEFEFRARTGTELVGFAGKIGEYGSDAEMVADFVVGWNLDEAFNTENLAVFLDNYPLCWQRILRAYFDEQSKAKLGN